MKCQVSFESKTELVKLDFDKHATSIIGAAFRERVNRKLRAGEAIESVDSDTARFRDNSDSSWMTVKDPVYVVEELRVFHSSTDAVVQYLLALPTPDFVDRQPVIRQTLGHDALILAEHIEEQCKPIADIKDMKAHFDLESVLNPIDSMHAAGNTQDKHVSSEQE